MGLCPWLVFSWQFLQVLNPYTHSGYITEAYTIYASSVLAAVTFLRGTASGCIPLFTTQIYSGLGSNIAIIITAAIATIFCVPPLVFFGYGRCLQEQSPFSNLSIRLNTE